jgi:carbon storage regulator
MLVLTRKPGEAIVLDGGIRVTVLALGRSVVRLGIEAPVGVGIVREELLLDAEERKARTSRDGPCPAVAQKA